MPPRSVFQLLRFMPVALYSGLLLCWSATSLGAVPRIAWVGSETQEPARQQAFHQALQTRRGSALELDFAPLLKGEAPDELLNRLNRYNLVFSVDAAAAAAIEQASFRGAHLALYRPNIERSNRARFSSIASHAHREQWQQLLAELAIDLPALKTIGMVFNAEERHHAGLWHSWLAQQQLRLQPLLLRYGETSPPFLANWLTKVDLWWMPPGHSALQAHEWPSAMLTALHSRKPVLAHAPEQLVAGAWLALFCSAADRDNQAIAMALDLLAGGHGAHVSPSPLTLAVNEAVAGRLNLHVDLGTVAARLAFPVKVPQAVSAH